MFRNGISYKVNINLISKISEECEEDFIFYDGAYNNYYHWWAECIINIEIYDYLVGYLPKAIIWNGKPELSQWQIDSLNILGIKIIHRVSADSEIVRLRGAIWIDKNDICSIPSFIFQRLSNRLSAIIGVNAGVKTKIYIKRRGCRTILNDEELDKMIFERGYKIVYNEEYSQFDQIMMYSAAETVIAVHGAGLTNMLFMPQGSNIIELMPSAEVRTFFWLMAEKLGHKYGVLMYKSESDDFNSAIMVDLVDLSNLFDIMDCHIGFSE